MQKTIYDLKLHECLTSDFDLDIIRVAGGWIYSGRHTNVNIFVPFNNEFMPKNNDVPDKDCPF